MPRPPLKSVAALIRSHARRLDKAGPSLGKHTPRTRRNPSTRFAPIRLAGVIPDARAEAAPFAVAFELAFPDGLTLRVAHDADPLTRDRLVAALRRPGE